MLLNFIPLPHKILAGALVVAGAMTWAYYNGKDSTQRDWDAQKAADVLVLGELKDQQALVTAMIDSSSQKSQEKIRTVFKTITKEVKIYVTPDADSACVVPNGFVLVHDAAASGTLPQAPSSTDAAPSGVEISTVAEVVAENYGTYAEIRQRLIDLQDWVAKQEALQNEKMP